MGRMPNLRFGLRTALLFTTAATIASWFYWDGLDRWRWRHQKQDFVQQVAHLQVRQGISHYWRPEMKSVHPPFISHGDGFDATGNYTEYLACRWPNELY